ncbi:MAG: TonB-dependent receptor [Candidatus Eremiobacteraeota bacterium]|nr:TonB-dependent receptor [Candidatus Eremiobacteraeota bacterium]
MSSHRTLRQVVVSALVAAAFLSQGTWALAGVTGNIAGTVKDANGAPVAGVQVQATAPSQASTVTTDAGGHFVIFSLNPDTYTLNLSKNGYQSISYPGIVVFADQTQQEAFTMSPALRTIAHVTSAAAAALVKSGVSSDLYQVGQAQIQASAAVGGGGNLNNIYSSIATTPGLIVGTGGMGWNQPVVIHGSNPFTSGFEYDGIPVNRAFDNYTASTGSSLGLQQLEVYTGGGPSAISSNGVSGFINQVIKTGTYPGYANINGGVATEAFYHQLGVEAGGSTPDRNFSYYVGLSGYNQAYRYVNQQDGSNIFTDNSPFQGYDSLGEVTGVFGIGGNPFGIGVYPICSTANVGSTPTEFSPFFDKWLAHQLKLPPGSITYDSYLQAPTDLAPGCLLPYSGLIANVGFISDREDIANFHFGIPRANGLRDDIQLLWSASALQSNFFSSPNDLGPGANQWGLDKVGWYGLSPQGLGLTPGFQARYSDALTYNQPFGTQIASCATVDPMTGACTGGESVSPVGQYFQPNSPAHSFGGVIPGNLSDLTHNDTGIVKAQYTHPLTENSYLRAYAYTFFSDWTLDGPNSGSTPLAGEFPYTGVAPNYNLITHSSGGEIQYANQINDQNLLQMTGNYTQANVIRFNNEGFFANGTSPIGLISEKNGVYSCWIPSNPNGTGPAPGTSTPCLPNGPWQGTAAGGPTGFAPPGSPGANAGAYWATLWNYNASGPANLVKPQFYNGAITDQIRPNDKLLFDLGVRYDNFTYNMPAGNSEPQNPFYAQQINDFVCYDYATSAVLTNPLGPGQAPPPSPVLTSGACPAKGYVHPGSTNQPFTLTYPTSYSQNYWEPRFSGTYTQSPDTVWRFSAGRFAEPPISASVNYLYNGGSPVGFWSNFMNFGFLSPFHPIVGQTSAQYSLSYERHMRGTQWSLKLTPFYNQQSNWEQQSFIGAGFVTQVPVGKAESYGSELALNYGDFSRNGWSGVLALTYTYSAVQFQNLLGPSQIDLVNEAIQNYNQLTKAGGGAECYAGANLHNGTFGTPVSCNKRNAIYNQFYNQPAQGLLNPSGWYAPGTLALGVAGVNNNPGFYNTPWVATLVANWRHDRLAITPSLQFESGAPYGSPLDVIGDDPRTCTNNQGMDGVADNGNFGQPGSAKWCDYRTVLSASASTSSKFPSIGYFYIPNPQTGSFASIGQFTEPDILLGNLQATYDISPKVRLQLTAAGIFHACFGGTAEPWTAQFPAGGPTCGYLPNGFGTANAFNGVSPFDAKANGLAAPAWEPATYLPKTNNTSGGYLPFNLFISGQLRL